MFFICTNHKIEVFSGSFYELKEAIDNYIQLNSNVKTVTDVNKKLIIITVFILLSDWGNICKRTMNFLYTNEVNGKSYIQNILQFGADNIDLIIENFINKLKQKLKDKKEITEKENFFLEQIDHQDNHQDFQNNFKTAFYNFLTQQVKVYLHYTIISKDNIYDRSLVNFFNIQSVPAILINIESDYAINSGVKTIYKNIGEISVLSQWRLMQKDIFYNLCIYFLNVLYDL